MQNGEIKVIFNFDKLSEIKELFMTFLAPWGFSD